MDSMLAASLPSPGSLTLARRPLPTLGPREVFLTVKATPLCGTDLRIITGQKRTASPPGVILGHEIATLEDHAAAIATLSTGALDLSGLITNEFPLTQVDAALDAVRSRTGLKVAVRPGRSEQTGR